MPSYWTKRDTGLGLRGSRSVRDFLKRYKKDVGSTSKVFNNVGKQGVSMIRERTLKGIDVEGNPFSKLEPKYGNKKGTSRRTLSSTGDPKKGLLGAITFKRGNKKVAIYVLQRYPEHIKAEVHNFGMISGRKAFQKPMAEGIALLNAIQDVYLDQSITIA